MSLSLASPATKGEEIIFKPQKWKRQNPLQGDSGYPGRATEQEITRLDDQGGVTTHIRMSFWLLHLIVTYITSLTVFGKNSTIPCVNISHGGPILNEGREEIFVEDLLCAKHSGGF